MSLLDVSGLGIDYPNRSGRGSTMESGPVVHDLSFTIEAGESLGVVGESGSGKTQTALAVMGLLPAEARVTGRILFDGESLLGADERTLNRIRARRIAMVFQDPALALNPYLRIGDQLRAILVAHAVVPRGQLRRRSLDLLQRVGLPDVERHSGCYPHQLSGGMRQRAMIAMALAGEPVLLIADEPTTALDVTVQAQILELLRNLRADTGIALMLITHDLGVIAGNCDRMLVMHEGGMLETGDTRDVFASPAQVHTRRMLAAALALDAPPAVKPLAGDSPVTVLEIDGLSVSYAETTAWRSSHRRRLHAVRSVSFNLHEGETLAIVGESGSGKTTAARAILGLVPPDAGSIRFLGEPLPTNARGRKRALRRSLQMVFQDPVGSLNPAMQVGETLSEALSLHRPGLGAEGRHSGVRALLDRVGLEESIRHRFPHELSGGQAQRVAFARALSLEPRVLVCDEAVAALDGTVRGEILALLLAEQRASGLSIVFITHDLAVVRRISHRVMVMYLGSVCEVADNEALFARPRHPYTRALMDAVPVPDPAVPRRAPMAGEAASTVAPPPGCAFHPRCPYAIDRCREEPPRLQANGAGGSVACHRAPQLDLSGRTSATD